MNLPIKARLTLWYTLALALIITALSVFVFLRLRADLEHGVDATLASRAQQIALRLPAASNGNFEDVGDAPPLAGLPAADAATQIIAPNGTVLQSSGVIDAPLVTGTALVAARRGAYHATVNFTTGSERAPYRILAVKAPSGSDVLALAVSNESVETATRRLAVLFAVALPAALGACALGGFLIATRGLRPIDRMTRAAAAIGSDDLSARLEAPAIEDEVGRLGRTLNQMLERLQATIEEQRRFAADASHELRTPLSIMRSEIDVALRSPATRDAARPTLESAQEELVRMTRIVEDLLTLARMDEGGLALARAPVPVLPLAREVAARFSGAASAKGIHLSAGGEEVTVVGDRERLGQLLSNLVDNAIKYTPEEGSVDVAVSAENGCVRLVVSDSGPGIPAESLPKIFDRFYRVDKARSRAPGGAGLGLSIARWTAESHGGSIAVESTPGRGARFSVTLPIT
jgi:heavy metal sensor kinase